MNCMKVSILIISRDMEHPSESRLNRFWKVPTGLDELVGRLAAQIFHFFGLHYVKYILATKSTVFRRFAFLANTFTLWLALSL